MLKACDGGEPRADLLREAKAELTAFADLRHGHWRKIGSTNPIERLDWEVERHTDVVGVCPDPDALLRLSACVLIEAHAERQDNDRRYLSEGSMALLDRPPATVLEARPDPSSTPLDQPALAAG